MNIFATEHPINSKLFRIPKRIRRFLILAVLSYPLYLLLLGTFYAIDGRGGLNFASERVRNFLYFPAAPIYAVFGPHNFYDDYLTFWYDDPNAPETTW